MANSKLFINISAVSIIILLLQTFSAVSSGKVLSRTTRQDDHVDEHDHEHGEGEYFVDVGNYLLEDELATTRISRDFEDNHEQNITLSQVGSLVSTLFSRVRCEGRVSNCSKVGLENERWMTM